MSSPRPPATRPESIEAELSRLLRASDAERENLLFASDRVEALVPRLPPEEMLFTLREMGRDRAAELLAHARPAQVRLLLDLEIWERDTILPERATLWLDLLTRVPDATLSRWVKVFDTEDYLPLLSKVARGSLADEEGQPEKDDAEGESSFTLDSVHYLTLPEAVADGTRRLLLHLRDESPEKFRSLLLGLLSHDTPEREEEAYRLRMARLAERGYVSFEEAQALYLPLSPGKFREVAERDPRATADEKAEGYAASEGPALVVAEAPGLRELLDRFADSREGDILLREIALLTHKVIVADGLDPAASDSYRSAAEKCAGYLSIGLELLAGRDADRLADTLSRHYLEAIYRVGATRVDDARKKARRLLFEEWPEGKKERLLFLDEPLVSTLDGLLRKRPKRFVEASGAFGEFTSLAEVEGAEHGVEAAAFLGRYLLEVVRFKLGDLSRAVTRIEEENLKGSTIFLTALANAALGREFTFAPIPRAEVARALSLLWEEDAPPRRVKRELVASALAWSEKLLPVSEAEKAYLGDFLTRALTLLEEQFGHLPPDETPDPRFLVGLWIE